ncbi:4Fe-4S binding protein [Desulfovibrio inopinatus]|uniref:4Fe-4S binding protein n=1 Tax=Desulfovibrio inopinatus TaxID=102109 RepID=UPI000409270B|nr:4Fe-4S binding protein [Desulfovibrio inopinatus]
MKKNYGALVVGAGIGGIRAALDLAETGHAVVLIDKRPSIGGILTQLDQQFPTDHCGMCKMLPLTERDSSSQFCMRKGLFHKNIDIMLSTELVSLDGDPGRFHAVLRKRSSFVDPHKCIGCGRCAEVCPVRIPDEFNAGLSQRPAVRLPVPHAIPNTYAVDLDNCQRCWRCFKACPTGAIDFKLDERKDFPILVADSDPETGKKLSDWFADLNFPIHAMSTGENVLEKLAADDRYKLLLLDMHLPDMDTERVVLRSLEIRPELTIILMVKDSDLEMARQFLGKGVREFLRKPLSRGHTVPWLDKLYMRIVSDTTLALDVVAVILAGGFDCYNPGRNPSGVADVLAYGSHPGVVTALEFERDLSGTGPGRGKLIRSDTGKPVRKIAWLQCVGSRDTKLNANYCSSICCMFSIKEALLAKRVTGGEADTAIFYMDMRTFGKTHQRYRDMAEREGGIRFIHARVHSVIPDPEDDGQSLRVEYLNEAGELISESFDMFVLATGVRSPEGIEQLAKATGVELNPWGFVHTPALSPARTSKLGVMAAGSMAIPSDIAQSVILSGAAAMEASRLISLYAPLRERKAEAEPVYRDVSRETPRILVALCFSCPIMGKRFGQQESEWLDKHLSKLQAVCQVVRIERACTQQGWGEIEGLVKEKNPNRILIGACMPYAYVSKLRQLGQATGLPPALMDVVDICSPIMGKQVDTHDEETLNDLFSRLNMASVKLLRADPSPLPPALPVSPQALVIGGGLAGMTAALAIADHGYDVCLLEESESLGGVAMKLFYTLEGHDPIKFMSELIEQVEKHPHIRVVKNGRLALTRGRAGHFRSVLTTDGNVINLDHGVIILATGGHESKVYEYGLRVHKAVHTQLELEHKLATGVLDTAALKSVVMIQCWRSREESRNYCSRICCAGALKNILFLKKKHPKLPIYVFYRDIMSYGFSESYYTQARKAGAVFIRYDLKKKPQVLLQDGKLTILARDPILDRAIEIHPDIVALSGGIEPNDVSELSEMLDVPLDQDGFFQEAEIKWRPVDLLKQGIFTCGLARAPGTMVETIASAKAAAQRSLRILSEKRLVCGNIVAEVRHSLCSRCGKCIDVCPYGARRLDMDQDRIVVDELLCQGCGSCAAVCPNGASVLRGFKDSQVLSVIDAALVETTRSSHVSAREERQ